MQLALDPSQMTYSDIVGPTAQRLFSRWRPIVNEHTRCVSDLWKDDEKLGVGPEMEIGALEFDLVDCRQIHARAQEPESDLAVCLQSYAQVQELSQHVDAFVKKYLPSWQSLLTSSTHNLTSGLAKEREFEKELINGMQACGTRVLGDLKPGGMIVHSLSRLPETERVALEQARRDVLEGNEEAVQDFHPCLRLLQILVAGNKTLSQIKHDLEDPFIDGPPKRTWLVRLSELRQGIEMILYGKDE